ncbi:hypothetical protein [Lentibacillus sp. Marseille-P4043]|uniref:hypothetical protein n=1 Tax=Lentibacillus sp. Marseille-P4043 TaxID=2040293 RepID=UPI00131A4E04|nr:hypothetical protein [Lentibacillus sp. Marseille-P4043]
MENNNADKSARDNDNLDGGPVENRLNSDNAFSDKGLENRRSMQNAVKKGNHNK